MGGHETWVFLIRNVSSFNAGPMKRMNTLIPQPLTILQNGLARNYWKVQVPPHLHIQNPSMLTANIDHQWMSFFYRKLPLYLSYFDSRISATGGQFSFIYSIAFWLKLFRLKPFPGASRLCQFVLMLPKQRDAIPHEAHKEFMPCQTAIMIDVVEVKDTARFLRRQQAVST